MVTRLLRPLSRTMSHYKLTYFDFRIHGEAPRWLLAASGASWEDIRLGYRDDDWYNTHKHRTPFGQLPTLEVDGVVLAQTRTIIRFLGKRLDFAGKNDIEEAQIDMIQEFVREMVEAVGKYIWYCSTEEEMEAAGKVWHSQKDFYFDKLDRLLKANGVGDGYFVGEKMSYADITFAVYLPYAEGFDPVKYPKLAALKDRVESDPRIAKYIKDRPDNEYGKSLYTK